MRVHPPLSRQCVSWPALLCLFGAAGTSAACSGADRSLLEPQPAQPSRAKGESGSGSGCEPIGQRSSALSVVDRSLVGSPAPYTADGSLAPREAELVSSQRLRRQAAWQVADRVLATIPLRAELGLPEAALPAWQTWHAKDDITRIFRRAYPELGASERATRAELGAGAIDAAWEWNDGAIQDFEGWTQGRLDAYRSGIDSSSEVAGLGGIYRVSYSPAASRHLLSSYDEVLGCVEREPDESGQLAASTCVAAERPAPACLQSEFPDAAVIVKASWRRADLGAPMPVFDTTAAGLARRLSGAHEFSWGSADGTADPSEDEIYTLRTPSGNVFRLAGLHIMSKELEHWFWITLWWSPEPSSDFGEDRPSTLPPPFDHYKLCSVVAFDEADAEPAAGAASRPSLAAALAATHAGVGGPTWCSNPYLEAGAGNAATNCIGCHQHAGTQLRPEDILGSAEEFPEFGRTEVRQTFPADYVFAPTQGDDLGAMFQETEDHFLPPEL
jgi:hypothetical protein